MLLLLSDHTEKGKNEFDRYCSILLIDIEQEKVYTYEGNSHSLANYYFVDDNKVIQESPHHIELFDIILKKQEGDDHQEKLSFNLESKGTI
jgi:hypothetical protein